jgi:hypothetical protein
VKIVYERSGGVAGIKKQAVVDTAQLAGAQRSEWEDLVRDAALPSLPAVLSAADPNARDTFTHSLRVAQGDAHHAVTVIGTPAEGPLRDLVRRLEGMARRPS